MLQAPKFTNNIAMRLSLFFLFLSLLCFSFSHQKETDSHLGNYSRLNLTSGFGPESLSFDCNGEGPYSGISDGRILKWEGETHGWIDFAVSSSKRNSDVCDGTNGTLETSCGRPLGLQFNNATCDLYIADSIFGLLVVGINGGVASLLANSTADGKPLFLANGVDVDVDTGVVYFSDSATQETNYSSSDTRGRLMKYDPSSKNVTVLLTDLGLANGVALSKNSSFVLVVETIGRQIRRLWLQGSKAQTSEVFLNQLPNFPDNIKRNARGEFWVGLTTGTGSLGISNIVGLRFDEEGSILETLYNDGTRNMNSISEVNEYDDKLWLGSNSMTFVSVYNYTV